MKHGIFLLSAFGLSMMLSARLAAAADANEAPAEHASPDRATLEKQLAAKLTHARLIGFYSAVGQEGQPKEDEYTLGEVQKKEGHKWLINANLQFGQKVISVPLEVPIYWAGDTPVISMTDFTVPGLGTYTARVMFYGDHYAGTWSSAKHGGYLWGHIQQLPVHEDKPPEHPAM